MESKELLDTVALLQEQIKTLKELVEAKDQLIQQLRLVQQPINLNPLPQPVYLPYMSPPVITCQHEYPTLWGGTTPPSCKKCGQPAWQPIVTCGAIANTGDNHAYFTDAVATKQIF